MVHLNGRPQIAIVIGEKCNEWDIPKFLTWPNPICSICKLDQQPCWYKT